MQQKKQHKRGYAAVVGGLFMILAAIGIITLVVLSMRLTSSLLDNQRQKEELEHLLQPVVMFDPVPFSSPKDIDNQRLLLYSMWGVLSDDNVVNYKRSDVNESLLVPAPDLEAAAHNLFGKDVSLVHNTFTDNQSSYFYDKENNTYQVRTYSFLYVYRPEVLTITKVDGNYQVLIHYIPPDNAWASIFAGTDTETLSTKQMIYTVTKVDGGWNLLSVKDAPRDGILDEHLNPDDIVPPVREAPDVTVENPIPSDETTEPIAEADNPVPPPVEDVDTALDDDLPDEDEETPEADTTPRTDTTDPVDTTDGDVIQVVPVEENPEETVVDEPVAGTRDS